ncbi:MAG: hypothetical protein K2X81_21945 [Candidatus Obscuribacterales bacterium]|nr:hypothetical protein [Candidatus Obscuribacterales bacterium]
MKIFNLVVGVILLVFLAACIGPAIASGQMPSMRQFALYGALLIFALSRFISFGIPDSPAVKPLRMAGLLVFIAYILMPRN